jgi:hypothetical protein
MQPSSDSSRNDSTGFPLAELAELVRSGGPTCCWGCGTWHQRSLIALVQPIACPGRGFLVPVCEPCDNLVRKGLGAAITDRIDAALAGYFDAAPTHEAEGLPVIPLYGPRS